MNIYFAGTVVGDPRFKKNQQRIVEVCEQLGHTVVSRRHAFQMGTEVKKGMRANKVFERDLWWLLRKSDAVVAELSVASYGLGFELGVASVMGLPILGLVADEAKKVSAFVKGNTFNNYQWKAYKLQGLNRILKSWLSNVESNLIDRKGVYIVFEGLNKSGKGTQIKLLVEKLIDQNYRVYQCREPGSTWLGEKLRNLVQEQTTDVPSIRAEVLMYAAQRAQLIEKEIKQHLQLGEIVVSDRSDGSSLAFQGNGRQQDILRISALNGYAVNHVHPDLVIYLRVKQEELVERNLKIIEEYDRLGDQGDSFNVRCDQGYMKVAELERSAPPASWAVIDGDRKMELVHRDVWQLVEPLLKEKLGV